jgi:hypothetical protein
MCNPSMGASTRSTADTTRLAGMWVTSTGPMVIGTIAMGIRGIAVAIATITAGMTSTAVAIVTTATTEAITAAMIVTTTAAVIVAKSESSLASPAAFNLPAMSHI